MRVFGCQTQERNESIKVNKTLVRNESEGGLGPLRWDAAD